MNIALFHLENSRSQRIVWLLEELGLAYEFGEYGNHLDMPETLKPVKYPTIRIEIQDQVIWLAESTAICEFLCEINDDLLPTATSLSEVADAFFWKSHTDGSFMHNMALLQVFNHIDRTAPLVLRPITIPLKLAIRYYHINKVLMQHLEMINEWLEERQWIGGENLTYLDINIWFPLMAATANIDCNPYPNIKRYLDDLSVRPEYMKAMRVGMWDQEKFKKYWE